MTQGHRAALVVAVAASACLGLAQPVHGDFGFSDRPHAVAGFREQLVVRRLTASVRPAGSRVRVAIDLSARARLRTTRLRLYAGRCNRGTQQGPKCDAGYSRPLTFRTATRTSLRRTITVPRPRGTIRGLAIWVGKPGQRPWDSAAYLRLPEQTWRFQAGESFGIAVPREGPILAARANVTGFDTDEAGISVKFTARSETALDLVTRLAPCDGSGPACEAREKTLEIKAGRAREYRVGASAKAPPHQLASFSLAGPDGESPLSGNLPWPVG